MTTETKIPVGMPSTSQKIFIMRDLTRRTGMLHEAQALNLRVWPPGFLGVKTSVAQYDHKKRIVTFKVGAFEEPKPDKLDQRLRYLDVAVKHLLGLDVIVNVKQGKTNLYTGAASTEAEWLALASEQKSAPSVETPKKKMSSHSGTKR